ncbi:hypothetical protein ACFWPX_36440 [Nocardia sp. NPDC058518]|uniref:hypothetical protein n=1 Tax=Nocardia sp. NPDC058518 TaxID=3346534 RepID=UPI0036563A79
MTKETAFLIDFLHAEGQSLREISRGVGVSLAVVHGEVAAARTTEPVSSQRG